MALALPALLSLIFLGRPVVRILFEHGEFDAAAGDLTNRVLVAYAVALPAYVAAEVATRGLIALRDTRTPLFTNTLQIIGRAVIIVLALDAFGVVVIRAAFAAMAAVEVALLAFILGLRPPRRISVVRMAYHRIGQEVTMAAEYVFIDEWEVDAPIEAVFEALADARTYPQWWRPVYLDVQSDGPPTVGRVSVERFKGRLPYRLQINSEIVRLDPPREFEIRATGDLSGRGVWTLRDDAPGGVCVRFDWRVNADRPLLRVLTPVLRPLFRANHNYAISRAKAGLERYARGTAAGARPEAAAPTERPPSSGTG